VWQVVQDMREQRMSLCQTLRQYVFVHAAVIEGALMVVDEEQEAAAGKRSLVTGRGSPTSSRSSGSHFGSSPSKGKRGASPTELLKKDRKGEVSLAKRPSTKRKQSGIEGRDAIFDMTSTATTTTSVSGGGGRRSLSGNGGVVAR